MVSPDGEYVGPVDSDGDPLIFEPVTGYGDFSGQDRFEVDNYQSVRLLARCVADHGFFLTPTEDGAGLLFQAVPPEQNQLAQAVLTACREGLRLEKPVPPTVEQLEEIHAYLIAVAVSGIGRVFGDRTAIGGRVRDSPGRGVEPLRRSCRRRRRT